MRHVVFKDIAARYAEPVEVFWLAGFACTEANDWLVKTLLRGRSTGKVFPRPLPIGLLPALSLGTCFDRGQLRWDLSTGMLGHAIVPDMADYELLTSADVPAQVYPLPSKSGIQKLFRYRTGAGDVLIPVAELVRALFVHNRALALALMRPAGLEQLFFPDAPRWRESARLRFTHEMPAKSISRQLALEFAWMAFNEGARRSWDSVRRSTLGQAYVLFQPPPIRDSAWWFRGLRHGNTWLVLELQGLSGRRLPFAELIYSHPDFTRLLRLSSNDPPGPAGSGNEPATTPSGDDVALELEEDSGSTSYRRARTADLQPKCMLFENRVKVKRIARSVVRITRPSDVQRHAAGAAVVRRTRTIQVTAGERASTAPLPPLDFRTLPPSPTMVMGDLEALDEAVRHMRDLLPDVEFQASLTPLKAGRAVSVADGARARSAMVVLIMAPEVTPIVLLDIERTGIGALSLMALRFKADASPEQIESAIGMTLDGLVERGGHWSTDVERVLRRHCTSDRIPKMLIPRDRWSEFGILWARRLIARLGLMA